MKIVLTGGPCAGKTTMTQIFSQVFNSQAVVLPEVASMLFGGGFPRWQEKTAADSAQRAIYHVQCEMEAAYQSHFPDHHLILDRGTLDGAAYWSTGTENRTEDWTFAKNLDIATRQIWSQHPNFSVIQNHHSFDTKIIKAINLVEAILKRQNRLKLAA